VAGLKHQLKFGSLAGGTLKHAGWSPPESSAGWNRLRSVFMIACVLQSLLVLSTFYYEI
jgi:hypothetical protein